MSNASINSYDLVFQHNRVTRAAACGFGVYGHDITLQQNLITEACSTKADCDAVCTFGQQGDSPCHDVTFDHNIVIGPIGNVDGGGMGFDTPMAFGFYVDNYSSSIVSRDNTVVDAPSSGILYQNSDGTLEDNTLFDTATDGGDAINAPAAMQSGNIELSTANRPNGELFHNATAAEVEIALTGSYQDLDGAPVSGIITLSPYESKVLLAQ